MDRTLLVVDDEPNIVSALTRLFRRDGYQLLSANSGRVGLDLLERHAVGVILSDQRMPEMTGTEFLAHAKEIQPNSVRIVLSGYTELTSVTDAINRGSVFRFLTKPWDDDLLRGQVRDAFTHYELREHNLALAEELKEKNASLEQIAKLMETALASTIDELSLSIMALKSMQQVLNQAPIAIIGCSLDGMVVVGNNLAMTLFPKLALGLDVADAVPPSLAQLVGIPQASDSYADAGGRRYNARATPLYSGDTTGDQEPCGIILTLLPEIVSDAPIDKAT